MPSSFLPEVATLPEVDRISVTTVVYNSVDNLRADEKVARRFNHARARKMPTLRAEHGLPHWVEAPPGGGLPGFLRSGRRFMRPRLAFYAGQDHFLPRYNEREGERVYIGRLDRED